MPKQTCYHYLRIGPAIGIFDRDTVFSAVDGYTTNRHEISKLMNQDGLPDYSRIDNNGDRYVLWKDDEALFNMRLPKNEWFMPSRGVAILMREDGKALPESNTEIHSILHGYKKDRRRELDEPSYMVFGADTIHEAPGTLRHLIEEHYYQTFFHITGNVAEKIAKKEKLVEEKEEEIMHLY